MKYAIYGVNRVSKDFLYIFGQLNIVCFFEEVEGNQFESRPVYSIKDLQKHSSEWDKIIICDFTKKDKQAVLEQNGLQYQRDFIYEEDLFYQLNERKIGREKKKMVVWGTGKWAEKFTKWNQKYSIEYYIDTYKKNDTFHCLAVKKPSEVQNWRELFVIIAIAKSDVIEEQLISYGLEYGKDFCISQELMIIPSELLKQTIFDRNCYNFECDTMFDHVEIGSGGRLDCCCTTFVKTPIGNIRKRNFPEIWKGNIHKILCLSTQNRTYSFCDKEMCPFFIGKKPCENDIKKDGVYKHIEKLPGTVAIGFDNTCNLKCVTCRHELLIANGSELARMQNYAQMVKDELLSECKFLIMAGDGEVFASQAYREIYISQKIRDIKWIRLLSNGTLFNQKKWEEFIKEKNAKIMLTVSIDAATGETYSKIRRGGDFTKLQENMRFASELRRRGELSYLRFNFVVQRDNYQEMILFVKWGLELRVDEIFFTKVLNWGTYNEKEFKEISMMEEDGVTPKEELKKVLDDPVMKNPIVDLGTIRYERESPLNTNRVDNYYKWELERKVPELFE